MSDKKQFLLVMVVAALFATWLGWRGFNVIQLNQAIQADGELRNYPYPFRVLRLDGDVAVMSTLRSPQITTRDALQYLFPSLRSLGETHREWQRAEREFARLQARAGELVLRNEKIQRLRWELDENWYHLTSMRNRSDGKAHLSPAPTRTPQARISNDASST